MAKHAQNPTLKHYSMHAPPSLYTSHTHATNEKNMLAFEVGESEPLLPLNFPRQRQRAPSTFQRRGYRISRRFQGRGRYFRGAVLVLIALAVLVTPLFVERREYKNTVVVQGMVSES